MHMQTLYDLIKEEDNLVRRREILDDMIVDCLYEHNSAPDEPKRKVIADRLDKLREEKGQVEKQLSDIRNSLKGRLFTLLQQ